MLTTLLPGPLATAAAFAGDEPAVANSPADSAASAATDSVARRLAAQLQHSDVEKRRDAAYELAELGSAASEALPELIKALRDDDTQVWAQSLEAIANLGPAAAAAEEMLLNGLASRDEQRAYRAAYALSRLGPATLPALRERLSKGKLPATERAATVLAIGWLGEAGGAAVSDLVAQLGDSDSDVRRETRSALARIGEASVAPLVQALRDENSTVQAEAAGALGLLAEVARDAAAPLRETVANRGSSEAVAESLIALAHVQPHDETVARLLAARLADDEEPVRQAAVAAWLSLDQAVQSAGVPLLTAYLVDETDSAHKAAYLIGRLGPAAEQAIDPLLNAYARSPLPDSPWASALSRMGPAAIGPLLDAVGSQTLSVDQAAVVLAALSFDCRKQLLSLVDQQQPEEVRSVGVALLPYLSPAPKDLLPRLMAAIEGDSSTTVRSTAIRAVGQIGPAAIDVQATLETAAKDAHDEIRTQALTALARIGAKSATLAAALEESLRDPNPDIRRQAAATLADFNRLPDTALAPLRDILEKDSVVEVRVAAAAALAALPAEEAVTVLMRVLSDGGAGDPDLRVRHRAMQSLGRLGSLSKPALPLLVANLTAGDAATRLVAIEAVTKMGQSARDVFPEVTRLFSDSDPQVRLAAVNALRKIQDEAAAVVPPLVAALDDADWSVRRAAATNLGEIGGEAKVAVPRLLQMLRSDDDAEAARQALREIDAAPEEAVPVLVEILQDEKASRQSRFYAMFLIRKAGPAAKQALPVLRKMLEEAEGRQREGLQRTIDEIDK